MEHFSSTRSVAVISDSHGLLRESVKTQLAGVDLIIHAGDVGKGPILESLRKISPLVVVRGNVDHDLPDLPAEEIFALNDRLVCVVHDIQQLDLEPRAAGIALVVSGHSHKPSIRWENGVCFLNPGSIGPRRFRLPICFAKIEFAGEEWLIRHIELAD